MAEPIWIIEEDCIGCNMCIEVCPATPTVFEMNGITAAVVDTDACERCMLCVDNCPTDCIKMAKLEDTVGGWEGMK